MAPQLSAPSSVRQPPKPQSLHALLTLVASGQKMETGQLRSGIPEGYRVGARSVLPLWLRSSSRGILVMLTMLAPRQQKLVGAEGLARIIKACPCTKSAENGPHAQHAMACEVLLRRLPKPSGCCAVV